MEDLRKSANQAYRDVYEPVDWPIVFGTRLLIVAGVMMVSAGGLPGLLTPMASLDRPVAMLSASAVFVGWPFAGASLVVLLISLGAEHFLRRALNPLAGLGLLLRVFSLDR